MLDVGCGTGPLAIEAAARVGAAGRPVGIDPAPRQIAPARSKARRAGLPVDFRMGVIEALPFPDCSFDLVTSTLMLHHLPEDLRRQGLAEIVRVLKSGGRLVLADFKRSEEHDGTSARPSAGETGIQDQPELIRMSWPHLRRGRGGCFPWRHTRATGAALVLGTKP